MIDELKKSTGKEDVVA